MGHLPHDDRPTRPHPKPVREMAPQLLPAHASSLKPPKRPAERGPTLFLKDLAWAFGRCLHRWPWYLLDGVLWGSSPVPPIIVCARLPEIRRFRANGALCEPAARG